MARATALQFRRVKLLQRLIMADVQKNVLSEEALERIKFSFSSKNSENVVAPCLVQVYMAMDPRDDPNAHIDWQLVTTGVVALLRNRESTKKGWVWNISVAIADRYHGMCVWKDRLSKESSYTILSDTFHVFAVNDIQAITAFVFESAEDGRRFGDTYKQWVRDKLRDDGLKGKIPSGPRFRREMISRPCNFQHISGSAALAQIQQMEDAKQAVGKVISTIGQRRAVSLDHIDGDLGGSKRHKKKDNTKDWPSRFEHMSLPIPEELEQTATSGGLDLLYSREPGSNGGKAPSVQATVGDQQYSNGINHNHIVESTSSIPQYHHQQQYGYQQQQNGGQQMNYSQQQYYEEHDGPYYNDQQNHHHLHQQDQSRYQNHQQGYMEDQSQPAADQEMKYEVEDIGYNYDDDVLNEPTGQLWRESIMEGTNWGDEMLRAWTMRSNGTDELTTTSEYS